MADSSTGRSGSAFRALTTTFLLLGLALLTYGLFHKSSQPEVLGHYSTAYAGSLVCIALSVALLAWMLWRPPPLLVHWVSNVYVFVISALFAIICAEIGLRILNPWGIEFFHTLPYHMQGMVDHPRLGYVHPKSVSYELGTNRVELNSHGLRDEEIPYAKPPDEKRILVLGDSVTFGWGVNQGTTFSDVMEPLLRARTGEKWQVINAGVNGYNSEQEATYLRIEGMRYEPDIVILFYVSNDVDSVFDPNLTTWRRYPTWPSGLPQLLERARSLSYLYQLSKLFARMESGNATNEPVLSITTHPGWPRSRTALEDIANQCKAAGIPLLVAGGGDPAFLAELQQVEIEAITMGPAWSQVPEDQRRVSRIDSHPSAAVHAKFAERLVDALQARGWLAQ